MLRAAMSKAPWMETEELRGQASARKGVDVGWLPREVPQPPLRGSRWRVLCPFLTLGPGGLHGICKDGRFPCCRMFLSESGWCRKFGLLEAE